jgi:integrase
MARKKEEETQQRGLFEKVPGSGMWWIRYSDSKSRYHREFIGGYTAAKDKLAERKAEKRKGIEPAIRGAVKPKVEVVAPLLFGDLIAAALTHSARENDSTHTHELELKFAKFGELAKKPAAAVTKADVQDRLDELADDNEWTGSTFNRYLAALSLVFRVAIENDKLEINPVTKITRQQETGSRLRFLNREEEEKLTATIGSRNPEYLPVFLLALHVGMRLSEQLRAKVGDFDAATGMLLVNQKKVKKAPGIRFVPLSPVAVDAYNALAGKRPKGSPLCLNLDGNPLSEVRYWFDVAMEKAGIEDFTWHCLRHCFASRLVMAGVPLAVVSKYLGHSTIQQTMKYSHLQPDNAALAVAALMGFYKKPGENA